MNFRIKKTDTKTTKERKPMTIQAIEKEFRQKRSRHAVQRAFIRANIGYVVDKIDSEMWQSAAAQLREFREVCIELHQLECDIQQLCFDLEGKRLEQAELPLEGSAA
jgi:hypothetical protein